MLIKPKLDFNGVRGFITITFDTERIPHLVVTASNLEWQYLDYMLEKGLEMVENQNKLMGNFIPTLGNITVRNTENLKKVGV